MFYVYVLTNETSLYTGFTVDLKRRLAEHNAGDSLATKNRGKWELLYYEAHTNSQDAKRREHYLKTSAGKQAIKRMLKVALAGKNLSFSN